MKTKTVSILICGSRTFDDYDALKVIVDEIIKCYVPEGLANHKIEIVSGGAKGTDFLGEKYAKESGYSVVRFEANWQKYGKAAGPIRNKQMVDYIKEKEGYVIGFLYNNSKGTKHTLACAKSEGIKGIFTVTNQRLDYKSLQREIPNIAVVGQFIIEIGSSHKRYLEYVVYVNTDVKENRCYFCVCLVAAEGNIGNNRYICYRDSLLRGHHTYIDFKSARYLGKSFDVEIEELVDFFHKPSKDFQGYTNWQVAIRMWNTNNNKNQLPLDLEMPDYTKLKKTIKPSK